MYRQYEDPYTLQEIVILGYMCTMRNQAKVILFGM